MNRILPSRSIDAAFAAHVGTLFERYVKAIQLESHDHERDPKTSNAAIQFKREFNFARITHTEMMNHIRGISFDDQAAD